MKVTLGAALLAAFALQTGGAGAQMASASPARRAADAYVKAHEADILRDFMSLLSLPNVAVNPSDTETNARRLETELSKRGFAVRRLSGGAGSAPTVFGELKTKGARRTVLYYAHYDGQPVGQAGWLTRPFEPVVKTGAPGAAAETVDLVHAGALNRDWRVYARSAGDDKATIEAFLTALDALRAGGVAPSVNIKVFWEGEEEQGSPHLQKIVEDNRGLLACDLIVMGDGPMHQSGRQLVNFGSRGVLGATLTVYGPLRPLHDGHYGSWAPSPAVEIAHLIAGLRAENGDINIQGMYDDVTPPTTEEAKALAALPPVEEDLQRDLGIGAPATTLRLADSYFRPTLNVRALHVGDAGEHAANAIAVSASASIDFRLTPGETPVRVRQLFEAELARRGWTLVRGPPDHPTRLAHPKLVEVRWDPGESRAVKTDLSSPAARAVVLSIERVQGAPVLVMPMVGASSGLAVIVEALKAPMAGVSIANADDNQHAENENLRLGALWDGVAVYAGLLSDLAF